MVGAGRHPRRVGHILGLALVTVLLGASWSAAGAPADRVRVVFQTFQSYGGLFIAEREGFFAAEQIQITWVTVGSTPEVIALLSQGQIDVGAGGVTPAFFNGISRGLKLRIVADKGHVGPGRGAPVLMVRRSLAGVVRSVADLKGRRVATTGLGDLGHYLLARTLDVHGVPASSVTVVTLPFSAHIPGLEGGGVDAAFLSPPLDQQAIARGIAFKLADPADYMPGEPLAFLFYGPTLLEQNRPLGLRFMRAYLRALAQYKEGPTPRNVAIIAAYTKVDPATVQKSGWTAIHPEGFVDVNKIRRHQDWLYALELVNVRNPMSLVADMAFVEQALLALKAPSTR